MSAYVQSSCPVCKIVVCRPASLPPRPTSLCPICEEAFSEVTKGMDSYHTISAREAIEAFAKARWNHEAGPGIGG